MKKFLSFSLLFSILFTGFLVAVPHTHEDDWNHVSHQSCPIYQASLEEWGASTTPVLFSSALSLLENLLPWNPEHFDSGSFSLPLIRGPPVLI